MKTFDSLTLHGRFWRIKCRYRGGLSKHYNTYLEAFLSSDIYSHLMTCLWMRNAIICTCGQAVVDTVIFVFGTFAYNAGEPTQVLPSLDTLFVPAVHIGNCIFYLWNVPWSMASIYNSPWREGPTHSTNIMLRFFPFLRLYCLFGSQFRLGWSVPN